MDPATRVRKGNLSKLGALLLIHMEVLMSNTKKPDEKARPEKKPGKDDYNPVNMAGRKAEVCKDEDPKQRDERSRKVD